MDLLTLHIIIPLATILGILLVKTREQTRLAAATGMGLQLILSIVLVISFLKEKATASGELLFTKSIVWYETLNIRYDIGVDGISVAMIMLTSIVIFTGVFASWDLEKMYKEFFIALILLAAGVFGFFISQDLFLMFLFFELAVIPMYLLIGIWGTGPKEYAAMKLTLMLMGGSALLLVGILALYYGGINETGVASFNIQQLSQVDYPMSLQRMIFPLTFIGFGVIGALFPFHTWSPDGHSSAPTAVSMLHAGVLMKLGGYGCLKVAIFLVPEAATEMTWIFLILTGISVIYGALATIRQTDLKYINAYSSVSHCGLVLFALLMMNRTAMNGAVLQMLSHGLMTALFFALIGMLYSRTNTRIVHEMGGLMKIMPFLSVCYVLAGLASLGLPGLSGFVAEMTIFVGAFQHADTFHRVLTIIAISSIVVTAVYILRVVGSLLMGPVKNESFLSLKDATWYEKVATITLLLAIIGIGIAPLWLSDMIYDSLVSIINQIASL